MTAHTPSALTVWSVVTCLWSLSALGQTDAGIRAITRPSADITLSFVQPGRVAKVHFKEGDVVRAGQVLARQDDAVEQAQLAQLKAQSENTTQIRASEASLAQKKVDLEKLEIAAARNAATPLEVQHAELDVKIAELSTELARFEHEQAGRKYEEQRLRVDNMQIKSPIDGSVEAIHVEVGESVNALAEMVQIVRVDPLWMDVPVPLARAVELKRGMPGRVTFPGPGGSAVDGQIMSVGAVADAASGTLTVRVEVPNPKSRPAGEHVTVAFQVSR